MTILMYLLWFLAAPTVSLRPGGPGTGTVRVCVVGGGTSDREGGCPAAEMLKDAGLKEAWV